ncbi:hypothetical protein DI487_08205 [Flavobacterium sediminis]|uniref:Multidrug transporter n=1 Tax=Flavobacterium sediminis TaxID=2201181 RepID=A0A2U8QYR6_9FLAO|nr:hypothetical protein DI487_08205 [Flavobacterium sediminis]
MKKTLWLALITASLAACSSDDNSTPTTNLDGKITSLNDPDYDAASLKGNVEGNITLAAGEYILDGALIVKSGYTLTINPGATIKARPGGTDVYLAVEQGAKIDAEGTSAQPILFTSNSGNPRSGDWGGVLLMGYAPISGGGTAVTEVVDFIYGGNNANDNSGTLKYVTVEYTGARINGDKEFNGFTFYGVGNGTIVDNIASMYGDDDAIEFFGGTVEVTNLLVVNAKDDMIDWTQGFQGSIDNAYAIREFGFNDVTSDPRGIEADGNLDGLSPNQSGQSNPTISNLTIVSNSVVELSDIVKIRRGSGVTITNALFSLGSNAVAPGDFIDLTDGAGYAADNLVSISGNATGSSLDINDIKYDATETPTDIPAVQGATINVTAGTTGGADTTAFDWTGYSF